VPIWPASCRSAAMRFSTAGCVENKLSIRARALRENEIEVTAVHSHMLAEQPRLFFMHFWANDEAIKLAKGLRTALDQVALAKD
jgi:Domain of Unknown Function (DUF1259)